MLGGIRESIATNLAYVRPWLANQAAIQLFQQVLFDIAAELPEGTSVGPNERSIVSLNAARDALVALAGRA